MSGSVAPLRAVVLTHRLLVRQLMTGWRIAAAVIAGAFLVIVAAAVGANDSVDDPLEAGVEVMTNLGFILVVPFGTLLFATAAFGETREDGTLVYLWLRPMDRWPVVLGAWLAVITVSLPITLAPVVLGSVLSDAGGGLVGASVLATVIGVVVYSATFLLLGLLLKNSIVWGIGYILVWEGIVAAFGSFAARLAIRGYTRSIITARTDVDLDLGDLSLGAAIIVPLLIAVAALVLSTARLSRLEVA